MNRKVVLLAILACAAVFLALAPRPERDDAMTDEAAAAVEAATETTSADSATRPADRPLPPPDAPLAQVIPGLQVQADAGNRRAACRLGMELLRCQHLLVWSDITSAGVDHEAQFEAEGNLGTANLYAEEKLWQIERLAQCEHVPDALRDEGERYLRQAALAGDPAAMLSYALGQHWRPDGRGTAAGAPFDAWRQEAPRMIRAAMQSGHPGAVFPLATAYGGDYGFMDAMIPDDPYQAFVHHLLAIHLFGHRERDGLRGQLGPDQVARARQEAKDLHQRYFKGRRYLSGQVVPNAPYLFPSPLDEPRPFCEDPV